MSVKLVAKPVVKDKFWVITDGKEKVGNVIAGPEGYDLKLNGSVEHFKNTAAIKKQLRIDFDNVKIEKHKSPLPFQQYPTPKRIYNSIFDIQRKIHLFTKISNSKCYYAAGWYNFPDNEELGIQFCPKYIFIQRYKYMGPYKTKDEGTIDK
jgi:hypothetical protein